MKFEGTRKSGVDPDVDVYTFTIGSQEIRAIMAALSKSRENMPDLFELSPYKHRANSMIRCLGSVCTEDNLKFPKEKDEKSIN